MDEPEPLPKKSQASSLSSREIMMLEMGPKNVSDLMDPMFKSLIIPLIFFFAQVTPVSQKRAEPTAS